jgi:hypothetical protein
VRFYYQYCPVSQGGVCGAENFIGVDDTGPSPYETTWSFPNCSFENEKWTIIARAEDNCGNTADTFVDDMILGGRGCFRDAGRDPAGPSTVWVSELSVPGGRGQVVLDGTDAVFPGAGVALHSVALAPARHNFEATLVDGEGAGIWRFDLSRLGLVPGSLRVVAGEVAQLGPDQVAFHLSGASGERLVFTFEVGSH